MGQRDPMAAITVAPSLNQTLVGETPRRLSYHTAQARPFFSHCNGRQRKSNFEAIKPYIYIYAPPPVRRRHAHTGR
jgi:hypothetical protein